MKQSVKRIYYFLVFSISFMSMALSGCVDLSGLRYSPSKYHAKVIRNNIYHGEVHTMRGGLWGVFSIGMTQLQEQIANKYGVPAYSTVWHNAGNESRFIVNSYYHQQPKRPIILIGHSLGGNEQIKVARNLNKLGIPVDLLITVDAVSESRVPSNVKLAMNVYRPGFIPMFSGLRLVADNPQKTHVENINVNSIKGINVNHFNIDQDKALQALILAQVEKVLSNGSRKQSNK